MKLEKRDWCVVIEKDSKAQLLNKVLRLHHLLYM